MIERLARSRGYFEAAITLMLLVVAGIYFFGMGQGRAPYLAPAVSSTANTLPIAKAAAFSKPAKHSFTLH